MAAIPEKVTKTPQVSIITPAYNAAAWIEETMRSVQAQTFENWELLVTDDGSTDDTAARVNAMGTEDARIRCISQPNGGMGRARNTAISEAKGTYLAFIDADDLWLPEKLEKQVQAMEQSGADLVYTAGWMFRGKPENRVSFWEVPPGVQRYEDLFEKQLFGFTVPVLSVLVSTDRIRALGGFEESRRSHFAADYQMWLRLMDAGAQFFGLNEGLFLYRLHEQQATHSDSLALGPVLWALKFADLKSISKEQKEDVMMQRLDRYIIHHADELSDEQLKEYISLYREPLGRPGKAFLVKMLSMAGRNFLKRVGYRFFNLNGELT